MTWNNNNLSDSQYVKQLKVFQSSDEMSKLKKEMERMDSSHKNDLKDKDKNRSILRKIFSIFRGAIKWTTMKQ